MRLPTVLMTDCIRSSNTGQSHGGAYLVDLEAGTWRKVLDWNNPDIRWEGRGDGRGLRGIAFHNGETYIAASDELFVFDQDFKIKRSFKNTYLGHCHELFLDGDTLYLASTRFDSVLAFDIPSGKFTKGWMFRLFPAEDPSTAKGPVRVVPRAAGFDPQTATGPAPGDSVHLNHAWVEQGRVYFCGVRMRHLLYFDPGGRVLKHADVPEWTHNARPFNGGVLCNSTGNDAITHLDAAGTVLKELPVPRYDPASLTNMPTTADVARQAFGRGLVTTKEGLVIGGSSPSTITVYEFETGRVVTSINITMDVRNAPHGLAVWPY